MVHGARVNLRRDNEGNVLKILIVSMCNRRICCQSSNLRNKVRSKKLIQKESKQASMKLASNGNVARYNREGQAREMKSICFGIYKLCALARVVMAVSPAREIGVTSIGDTRSTH